MRPASSFERSRPLSHRLLCAVLAVSHALTMAGVPLPAMAAPQEAGAFPCRGHQCGCRTAEQCWNRCCCFNREQRLAWAEAHHVTPPDSLLKQAPTAERPVTRSCCEHHDEHAEHADHADSKSAAAKDESDARRPSLNGTKCQGVSTIWLATGAVTPPPSPIQWNYQWVWVGSVQFGRFRTSEICLLPAVPPPQA